MKFVLFVEGHTEHRDKTLARFLKRWLDAKLTYPVGIQTVRFDGWRELVDDSPKKARLYLNNPKRDVIAVIALLDLYGPTIYPARLRTAAERLNWAKPYLEKQVGQPEFRQFFAIHETEAWLLSDPAIFPAEVGKALPGKIHKPETVNFDEPPAKLLDQLYNEKLKRNYKKTTDGAELFSKLDPVVASAKCPALKSLLDEMLVLAQDAGL